VHLTEPASLRHSLSALTTDRPAQEVLGRAFPEHVKPGVIQVQPLPTTRARMGPMQFELGPVELVHAQPGKGAYELSMRTQRAPLGDFTGRDTPELIQLSWKPRQVGEAEALARHTSDTRKAIPMAVDTYGLPAQGASQPWPSLLRLEATHDVLIPEAAGLATRGCGSRRRAWPPSRRRKSSAPCCASMTG
jgi:hypothetical protein